MYIREIENKISLYFGLHEHEIGKHERIIDQTNYPLQDIIQKYNCIYFNNTISYMIAYALFNGVKEITMYGIDMNTADEYYAQRGSVMYWVGFARGQGIKVNMMNGIDQPAFLYGFENHIPFKDKLKQMRSWANMSMKAAEGEDKKNQFAGFLHAIDIIEKEM